MDFEVFQPEAPVDLKQEVDHFCILLGAGDSDGFDSKLVVLSVAARLGALIAKHWTDIKEFVGGADLSEVIFDEGPHDRGGPLWAEADGAPPFIFEGEHLFGDDVGCFADSAVKELSSLVDGSPNFSVAIFGGRLPADLFESLPSFRQAPPLVCSIGKDVKSSLGDLDFCHDSISINRKKIKSLALLYFETVAELSLSDKKGLTLFLARSLQ